MTECLELCITCSSSIIVNSLLKNCFLFYPCQICLLCIYSLAIDKAMDMNFDFDYVVDFILYNMPRKINNTKTLQFHTPVAMKVRC